MKRWMYFQVAFLSFFLSKRESEKSHRVYILRQQLRFSYHLQAFLNMLPLIEPYPLESIECQQTIHDITGAQIL